MVFSCISGLITGFIINSSRALDKIQSERLTATNKINDDADQSELSIRIMPLTANKTLTIMDTGTGMTKSDLGAIVNSGTKQFMPVGADLSMIDPLGVSFYSARLVVEKVVVITKHKDDEQYVCESHADGSFTITRDASRKQLGRGTKITLFLKQAQVEYLEERRIKDLVMENCESISYPVYLWGEKPHEHPHEDIIQEVSYGWQLIYEHKSFGNHPVSPTDAGPTQSYGALCQTIKGILGEKVVKVIIGPESSFYDSSSRFSRITRKGILKISPDSAEELNKLAETGQLNGITVQLLFEAATKPKKKKHWANALTLCCTILQLTASVINCVSSG